MRRISVSSGSGRYESAADPRASGRLAKVGRDIDVGPAGNDRGRDKSNPAPDVAGTAPVPGGKKKQGIDHQRVGDAPVRGRPQRVLEGPHERLQLLVLVPGQPAGGDNALDEDDVIPVALDCRIRMGPAQKLRPAAAKAGLLLEFADRGLDRW